MLEDVFKKNYKEIAPRIYLVEESEGFATIAIFKGERVFHLKKFIYTSNKGKYLRIKQENGNHRRVYYEN